MVNFAKFVSDYRAGKKALILLSARVLRHSLWTPTLLLTTQHFGDLVWPNDFTFYL